MEEARHAKDLTGAGAQSRCRISPVRPGAVSLLAYLLIAIVIFFPLIRNFGRVIPGILVGGDAFIYLWDFWWLDEGAWRPGQSLLWTDYQSYPVGTPLSLHPFSLTQLLPVWPIYRVFGPLEAYETNLLISFILTGFFTYLLARRLLQSHVGGFLAGVVFMLSPFYFAHAHGHVELIGLQWVSLCFLLFLRWLENRSYPRALAFASSAALVFYTSPYLTLNAIFMCLLWLVLHIRRNPVIVEERRFWLGIGLVGSFSVISVGPLLIPMLARPEGSQPGGGVFIYSADLLGFFVPGAFSVWGNFTASVWREFAGNPVESATYLGYVPLFLAVLGAYSWRERRRFWVWLAALGFVLSLGPYLHVGGKYEIPVSVLGPLEPAGTWVRKFVTSVDASWRVSRGHIAIPMPYYLLTAFPYIKSLNAPSRFVVLVYLSLGLLAGAGLSHLLFRMQRWRAAATVLVIFLVGAEFYPRLQFLEPRIPPFFQAVAREPGDFVLLDLSPPDLATYHQMVHGKKIIGGWVGRGYEPAVAFVRRSRLHDLLIDRVDPRAMSDLLRPFRDLKVRYVVVPLDRQNSRAGLERAGWPEVYRDGQIVVFQPPGRSASNQ